MEYASALSIIPFTLTRIMFDSPDFTLYFHLFLHASFLALNLASSVGPSKTYLQKVK